MYYLRIYSYEVNGFGFVVDDIHDITPDDIPILNDDYNLFFEKYNGRMFRVRKTREFTNLFEILEECYIETEID